MLVLERRTVDTFNDQTRPCGSTIRLRAGPLELHCDQEIGWVRRIMFGDQEIIRSLYGAVRLSDWATVTPVLRDLSVNREPNDASFEIRFTAECRAGAVHFVWNGRITGNENAEVRFEFDGETHSEFLSNRIGLCVLYPIARCIERPCRIEHADGSWEDGEFPKLISPHQPFRNIRAIRQNITNEIALDVRFNGEVFEMEDQRNWTDTSFKVYGTPLERPFPILKKPGDKVKQVVTLKLIKGPKSSWPNLHAPADPFGLKINFSRLRPRPLLGLGFAHGQELTPQSSSALRALNLDHLRVDCRLGGSEWESHLNNAARQAHNSGAGLHVAVFVNDHQRTELQKLGNVCATLRVPIRLWLIFHDRQATTPPPVLKMAREILAPCAPSAKFSAGTDRDFAELNRARPPGDADWLPCCSMNPQVHAFDDLSIIENLAAQADVVSTVRSFSPQPLVVSPITLLPRGGLGVPPADPRQSTPFAAGWTLGSLSMLMNAPHPVHSLTYFETSGPRGLVTDKEVFPVYHVLRVASSLAQVAATHFMDELFKLRMAALAGVNESGRAMVLLANLTDEAVRLHLEPDLPIRAGSLSRINADSGPALSTGRLEDFDQSVRLSSREIVHLEMET